MSLFKAIWFDRFDIYEDVLLCILVMHEVEITPFKLNQHFIQSLLCVNICMDKWAEAFGFNFIINYF